MSLQESQTEAQIFKPQYPITAIILAAGLSRRMGERNKLLLPIGGQTLIEKTVNTILQSNAEEIIVVVGHESVKLLHILKEKPVKMIKNPLYSLGMTTSIQAGVRSASKDSQGYMIVLGDLVHIQAKELDLLMHTFQNILEEENDSTPIVVPVFEGKRGNPILFHHHFREAILQHSDMNGCKGIIDTNSDCVVTVEMSSNHVLKDIDTPEDYDSVVGN
ncbi:MAG: nucleotidyltransferase family protein [Chitinophagales bacterium]